MVYVVQEDSNKNLLAAQEFGEIRYLFPEGKNIMFSAGHVVRQLMGMMQKFCDKDYLLLVGDPAAIGIATAVASHWNKGRIKMLKWDRIQQKYFSVSANLYPPKGENYDNQIS